MATQPIIINNWQKGIAQSPHVGFGLFRNVDIDSFPGAIMAQKLPQSYFITFTARTFTADAGTDNCTASDSLSSDNYRGQAVYFTTTGTLPGGLSTGTVYFLIYSSATVFKVATSYKNSVGSAAGTQIDITSAGTGTHTVNPVAVGTINWILEDQRNGYYWAQDSNGRIWFVPTGSRAYLLQNSAIDTGTSYTNAAGNGIALFATSDASATYLFTFRNALIDVKNVYGDTAIEDAAWSNGWQTMNTGSGSGATHEAKVGQDNIIYYTDDRYVGSIRENSGFVFSPATGSTYTFTQDALDMPQNEITQCLEEQGTNLLIGGSNSNLIYPWDRVSDSYNLPIPVPEFNIRKMKNIGGTVCILVGTWGNIYTTQGTYVKHLVKIPTAVVNNAFVIQSSPMTWGGITQSNGTLLCGLLGQTANSSGVYRVYLDGRVIQDNYPPSGSAQVQAIYGEGDFYQMGYSGGWSNFGNLKLRNDDSCVVQSELYQVATNVEKGTFSRLEVICARAPGGGNITIAYREDDISSFTNITGASFTGDTSTVIFTAENVGLIDIEQIQLQVTFEDANSGNETIIREVRLLP